jgi:hypothetical protein
MAKGLFIKRTVHLPADTETANGRIGADRKTISWTVDLRNRAGLAETTKFLEGPGEGQGEAVFDASALEFSLPLRAEAVATAGAAQGAEDKSTGPAGINADIVWVCVTKAARTDSTAIPEKSFTEMGLEVTWNEGHRPVRCEQPVLLSLLDDKGTDLMPDSEVASFAFQLKIREHEESKELTIKAKAPSAGATKLKDLEGYVEVVTEQTRRTIVLDNVQELAGKEATGDAVLDKMGFRIKEVADRSLTVATDEEMEKILSLDMIKGDGSEVARSGSGGWEGSYSYHFREEISKLKKCEIEVVTGETKVKIPFAHDEIALP